MTTDAELAYWSRRADREEREKRRYTQSDGIRPLTDGWLRYNRSKPTVRVIDAWGKERWITPTQAEVLNAARKLQGTASMGKIAASLGVVTSTVYRALLRLASMGLVAYDVKRGRSGGVTFIRAAGDALQRRAQAAWEKLKYMRLRALEGADRRSCERAASTGYPLWAIPSLIVAPIREGAQRLAEWSWTPAELAALGL
jgi:DNA-binding MarR family transcriptional regulator